MTKILIDEAVVRRSLEALDTAWDTDPNNADGYYFDAAAALRQALEQPAPAQSWVGLTVAEQNELCRKTGASRHQVRSVEAKLKEKNTSAHGITKGNT
jgi:hypothetical protein